MKKLSIIAALLLITNIAYAKQIYCIQDSVKSQINFEAKLDSVKLPSWKLHFGLFSLPKLNELQKIKVKKLNLENNIKKIEQQIENKQFSIQEKKEAIKELENPNREKHEFTFLFLGLFSQNKLVKGDSIIYNEKRLLWGIAKWGKLKQEPNDNRNNN